MKRHLITCAILWILALTVDAGPVAGLPANNQQDVDKWYSVDHFVMEAKTQLTAGGLQFPFDRTTPRVWFCPSGQECVIVVFDQGLGKDACSVWLNRAAKVLRHVVAVTKA